MLVTIILLAVFAALFYCIVEVKKGNERYDALMDELVLAQARAESVDKTIDSIQGNLSTLNQICETECDNRRKIYAELRGAGKSKKDAAIELGVSTRTASRYENWYKLNQSE